LQSGVHTVITLEGSTLFIDAVGLGKFELLAETSSSFTIKGANASLEFKVDEKGFVKAFVLLQSGGKMEAKKVE
jgi:hypothetical protein